MGSSWNRILWAITSLLLYSRGDFNQFLFRPRAFRLHWRRAGCLLDLNLHMRISLLISPALSLGVCLGLHPEGSHAAEPPAPKDLNTQRSFPQIGSASEWKTRASQIRQHVLDSCGLWPMPDTTPLNAKVFGRVERDGYSVEKVALETLPGFYLGGNLYRPLGKGAGPFPAVLNPHGHWQNGRMADEKSGSIAGRCISFARQGMIAF